MFVNLVNFFSNEGYKTDIVLMHAKGEYLGLLPSSVNIVDLHAGNIFSAIYQLIKYLRRSTPDVMLSTLIPTNIVAILARLLSRRKFKLYLREANTLSHQMLDRPLIRRILLTRLIRMLYPLAEGYVGISRIVSKDLSNFINVPESKIATIYNPCDISRIEQMAQEDISHKWLSNAGPKVIIGVGRLTHQKDFATLIKAFALVRKEIDARLIILGKGEEEKNLTQLIANLHIQDSVELLGFKQNPYAFIAKSSLFVLPSIYEGASNVILEAMACGTPLVCTDCPGANAEILNYGEFGTLVPVGDIEAMAIAIIKALDHKYDKEFIKLRAKDFLLEKIAPQYLKVLGVRDANED